LTNFEHHFLPGQFRLREKIVTFGAVPRASIRPTGSVRSSCRITKDLPAGKRVGASIHPAQWTGQIRVAKIISEHNEVGIVPSMVSATLARQESFKKGKVLIMDAKQSTYAKLGLPSPFGQIVLTLALVLLLAPYLVGADIGIFKIPDLPVVTQRFLKYFGPILLVVAVLLYYPFWEKQASGVRSAGTYVPIKIVFQNCSEHFLKVNWINFEGKNDPECYYTLAPGESKEVDSFVAHAWSVSNANTGAQLKPVIVTETTSTIRIP
jgi:hypothetical protein